jgi:hypothetical protein
MLGLIAILLSPGFFRAEVSGRAEAQPVRQCLIHLLPVKPTSVGRTDLAARGVPKRVPLGELNCPVSSKPDTGITEKRREPMASAFRVCGLFPKVCAIAPATPALSVSGKSSRGASATPGFTLARRNSRAKTLRLSRYHTPPSYHCSYARGYEQSRAPFVKRPTLARRWSASPCRRRSPQSARRRCGRRLSGRGPGTRCVSGSSGPRIGSSTSAGHSPGRRRGAAPTAWWAWRCGHRPYPSARSGTSRPPPTRTVTE